MGHDWIDALIAIPLVLIFVAWALLLLTYFGRV